MKTAKSNNRIALIRYIDLGMNLSHVTSIIIFMFWI